ncbi:MAG: hypothetical protein ABSE73_30820, partial [Planctomycetota bacterium]
IFLRLNMHRRGMVVATELDGVTARIEGEVPLAALRETRQFDGFKKGELPAPPAVQATNESKPLPLEGSLLAEAEKRENLAAGGAALSVPEKGKLLTFRRVEGYPELTLTLRSVPATWRYVAVGIVALLVIGLVVGARRARRNRRA